MSPATAVIITYNSGAHLGAAVASCRLFGIPVVIVDNASTDGTVFPGDVTVLRNEANRGFAAAVNQGVRAHRSPLTLLLNPDARLLTGIAPLCDICAANRHTAAAGLLVEADRKPQKGFSIRRLPTAAALVCEVLGINRIWPGNPVNQAYRCMDLDLTKTQTVEQPAGALFLFRRDDWEELGGFDERYFPVWFEDVDFARRFRDSGGTIVLEPSVLALHVGGHSVQKLTDASRIRFWYGSLLRYVVQHFGAVPRRLVAGCVLFGLAARCILGIFLLRGWPALGAHLDCIRLSARCVVLGKIKNH